MTGENRGSEAGEEEGRQKDKYKQPDRCQGRMEKRISCVETKIVSEMRKETKNQTEVTKDMDYKREKREGKSGVSLSRQVNKSMGKADFFSDQKKHENIPGLSVCLEELMRV